MASKLNKIILHWSASQYRPNADDLKHYHFMICGDGTVRTGIYKSEDNINCKDGEYAAHALGANTGSIGVALCGMLGYKSPKDIGKFPITKQQIESLCKLIAQLCKQYKISIDEVYTHMIIDQKVRKLEKYDNRKIDIIYLPCNPELKNQYEILEYLKGKIRWYLDKIESEN